MPWSTTAFLAISSTLASCQSTFSSTRFTTCSNSSQLSVEAFSASLENSNGTLAFSFSATSNIFANVTIDSTLWLPPSSGNDRPIFQQTLDPCSADMASICPLPKGPVYVHSNLDVASASSDLGDTVTNLRFRMELNPTEERQGSIMCAEAPLAKVGPEGNPLSASVSGSRTTALASSMPTANSGSAMTQTSSPSSSQSAPTQSSAGEMLLIASRIGPMWGLFIAMTMLPALL